MAFVPRLAFTTGEPAGIGVDLAILLAQSRLDCELIFFSNRLLLTDRANILNLPIQIVDFEPNSKPTCNKKHQIKLIDFPLFATVIPQKLNPKNADFVLNTIEKATEYCLNKVMDGLITAPIHKGVINQSGVSFTGHTEFLQAKSGVSKVVMMLLNDKMRVALLTTHLPLKSVAETITKTLLIDTLKILHHDLQTVFHIKNPRILVAGLNPHAGEDGFLGNEEITEIKPALNHCRDKLAMNLSEPIPADTLFNKKLLKNADAVLAMYHDQGLPVLKYSGFGKSVNITLGLPFIRTSVDHGTALDLAGTGAVDIGSLNYALALAIKLVRDQQ